MLLLFYLAFCGFKVFLIIHSQCDKPAYETYYGVKESVNTITDGCYFIDEDTFECVRKETPEYGEENVDCDEYHSSGLVF
jgi:hypothetical protein